MDEFKQLALSLTQSGLNTSQIRKAMVAKVRDVIQCIQYHSSFERIPGIYRAFRIAVLFTLMLKIFELENREGRRDNCYLG